MIVLVKQTNGFTTKLLSKGILGNLFVFQGIDIHSDRQKLCDSHRDKICHIGIPNTLTLVGSQDGRESLGALKVGLVLFLVFPHVLHESTTEKKMKGLILIMGLSNSAIETVAISLHRKDVKLARTKKNRKGRKAGHLWVGHMFGRHGLYFNFFG
jgi:hypothetical protein